MALGRKEVEDIALLARLGLSEAEVVSLTDELGKILGYVDKLGTLDTEGIEPTTHAVPMDCPLRPDEPQASLTAEQALGQAPRRVENFFAVPRIIEVPEK